MRRISATLVAVTLGLTACGGDDDTADEPTAAEDGTADSADETEAETVDEPTAETAEPSAETADEPTADEDTADLPTAGGDTSDGGTADEGTDDGGPTIVVNSLDDIPQQCRDLMADFLQQIEPIVSPIDWETASFSDFEQIAADFEQEADAFETASEAEDECSNLDLETDENFDLLIEFADDVAPGTSGFLAFLASFANSVDSTVDDGDGSTGDAAGVSTCDDAIAYMQDLFEEYDSIENVPVTELSEFTNLGMVMGTCSPEQLEFFDSDEFNEFVGG